jgi:tetratricopeptide (TPR) repeat protein
MEDQEQPLNQEQEKPAKPTREKKEKKPNNEKFKWWQSLLILSLTLVVSVGAAYYISDKYFWSKYDDSQLQQQFESFKAQVEEKPNDPKHRVNLGYAYFLKGDNDEAIKQLKLAMDLDENYYDAYFNLGLVYNDEERLDDAIKMAQKATEISPRDYKGFLLKGMIYRKLKMYEEAIKALNEANTLMPANTDIIYEAGRVAEERGDKEQAEEIYRDALSYDPLYKPAIEGLDRVAAKKDNTK